jgi:hypothetical protein
LSGFRRKLAYRYFFTEAENFEASQRSSARYVCLAALPLYFLFTALFVFLFGVRIGAAATYQWLRGCVVAMLTDIIILQPLKIWIKWIVLAAGAANHVRVLHGLLRERAKTIMLRKTGLLKQANSLIQHFNPACRAARAFPDLPVARLLMSLNDYDLPMRKYLKKKKSGLVLWLSRIVVSIVVFSLFLLTSFPELLQDAFMEVGVTTGLSFGFLAFVLSAKESVVIPVVLSLALASTVAFAVFMIERDRRAANSKNRVLMPVDAVDNLLLLESSVHLQEHEKVRRKSFDLRIRRKSCRDSLGSIASMASRRGSLVAVDTTLADDTHGHGSFHHSSMPVSILAQMEEGTSGDGNAADSGMKAKREERGNISGVTHLLSPLTNWMSPKGNRYFEAPQSSGTFGGGRGAWSVTSRPSRGEFDEHDHVIPPMPDLSQLQEIKL